MLWSSGGTTYTSKYLGFLKILFWRAAEPSPLLLKVPKQKNTNVLSSINENMEWMAAKNGGLPSL